MAICITFGTHGSYSLDPGTWILVIALLHPFHEARRNPPQWTALRYPPPDLEPVIPLAMHKYKEVTCYTCRFTQDLRDRPDINPDTRPPANAGWGPQPPPQAYFGGQQQQQQQQQQQMQYPPVASGATSPPPQQYAYK
ncbi:rhodopsin family protein [Aspergillus mulundensis]|uniref:Uncharacterized protein n=1 Tax=Aspergillus mulundensis TaxID=1810919 RepID=A0A3D8R9B1_9EURO|nr:hypothetical protein DSM5745_08154 [Aspergillus mulundensis]RDW70643.1 hypothetical protein DSM5745_08154 [Aspergillus mulundensis]